MHRRISLDLFAHTLDLDLKFHLLRKTGEVTRIMDRGTSALQNILSTVIFNIGEPLPDQPFCLLPLLLLLLAACCPVRDDSLSLLHACLRMCQASYGVCYMAALSVYTR